MAALSAFAKYVRPSVPGCPEPMVLDAILRAAIDFCSRTKAFTVEVPITTAASTNPYTIPLTTGLEPVEVNRVMRSGFDLDPSSLNEAHTQRLTVRNDLPRAFWMDENNKLMLAPTPNNVETLTAIVAVSPTYDATTVPDGLLRNRRFDKIAAGARSFLMEMPNQPWSNIQQADVDRGIFEAAIDRETLNRARGNSHKPLRNKSSFY